MKPILLTWHDLALASLLLVADAALSLVFWLGVHRRLAVAGARMVIQLILVGYVLRLIFATAIRPQPWWDPYYAIPLAGIILGSVLNAASLSLDGVLERAMRERAAIEAQLALGLPYREAMRAIVRDAARTGLLPVINQMSAAGLITLPGIITGQILAGFDPMEAVKVQILLMFLLAGGSGLATVMVA